jgi:3-hydroxybutyryl-CoA dehydrogenase
MKIGIIGSGAMGLGIAQISATAGYQTLIFDNNALAHAKANMQLSATFQKLVEKGKLSSEAVHDIQARLHWVEELEEFADCDLVIEAIVEDLAIKREVFQSLESIIGAKAILATNTSSLAVAALAAGCQFPQRVIGIHFFNPVPLMELVEIIPAVQTEPFAVEIACAWVDALKKKRVMAKDTPGFIVNRVARPYYGEAIRMLEEGIADCATIDWAMTSLGGFRMGPFTLMDFIGMDVNYRVTESVWTQMFFEPRFKPSLTQKRLFEAGFYGKKSGRGFYNYQTDAPQATLPQTDPVLGETIFRRILAMLINEAADAVLFQIGTAEHIDIAMTKGVNYPKGLLLWADEWGIENIVSHIDALYEMYREDRYRCSALLRKMAKNGQTFYPQS